MDDFLRDVYLHEIVRQCEIALRSDQQLREALYMDDRLGVWQSIQSFLAATANLSKLLTTPKSALVSERGDVLRGLLAVAPSSPVLARTMRNHVEHFDERLDTWAATDQHRRIVTDVIGPEQSISVDGAPVRYHRRYDPSSHTFHFLDDSIDLRSTCTEVRRICDLAHSLAGR